MVGAKVAVGFAMHAPQPPLLPNPAFNHVRPMPRHIGINI